MTSATFGSIRVATPMVECAPLRSRYVSPSEPEIEEVSSFEAGSPFVSVIIPVFNDEARLGVCLSALEKQTYASDRYEVVVVDNGSARPIAEVVGCFPHASVVVEWRRGSYAARNRGLALARGDVLAFTDADCVPAADWLEQGVRALLAASDCGLIAGDIHVLPKDPRAPSMVELYELTFAFRQSSYVAEGFGATANLFTRRQVFERVGLFCDGLKSCGDREWGLRVSASGLGLRYASEARVDHPARRSWRELARKTLRVTDGMFDLARMEGKGFGNSLRVAARELRPPLLTAMRVFTGRAGPPGLRQRLSVIAVLTVRRWITAFAWLRLEAGSSIRR